MTAGLVIPDERVTRGVLRRMWESEERRRFSKNTLGVASVFLLVGLGALIVIGPHFLPDPNFVSPADRLQAPGQEHLLGTDHLGRDMFARLLVGGRISLLVAIAGTTGSLLLGVLLGVTTGYLGGLADDILSRVFDILISFPTLLLGIIIVVTFGGSMGTVILAVSIGSIPLYGRLFRAGTLSVKPREYVQAVTSFGVPHLRIAVRHVLPNIIIPVVVIAAGNMGRMALTESALSFLGAGIQPPTASWGNMIAAGQPYLQYAPWIPIIPGTLLTAVALAFSFIGDALRDAFDVHESSVAGETTA